MSIPRDLDGSGYVRGVYQASQMTVEGVAATPSHCGKQHKNPLLDIEKVHFVPLRKILASLRHRRRFDCGKMYEKVEGTVRKGIKEGPRKVSHFARNKEVVDLQRDKARQKKQKEKS